MQAYLIYIYIYMIYIYIYDRRLGGKNVVAPTGKSDFGFVFVSFVRACVRSCEQNDHLHGEPYLKSKVSPPVPRGCP